MHRTSSAVPALDNEVLPVGDLPLAPFALTGISEAELARAVIDDRPPAATDTWMLDLARRSGRMRPDRFG
jgi:hypothetical protein